jgi:uncharacterized membrane protein YphA (DoxX/SURF4 family)
MLGAGLLLLRLSIGIAAPFQAVVFAVSYDRPALLVWCAIILAICSGICLVLGFLTPVAGFLTCLLALLLNPPGGALAEPRVFGFLLSTVLIVAVAAAIALTGPGAWSMDARVFGLRRIAIPRAPEPPV